jgi:hypothetical protein
MVLEFVRQQQLGEIDFFFGRFFTFKNTLRRFVNKTSIINYMLRTLAKSAAMRFKRASL